MLVIQRPEGRYYYGIPAGAQVHGKLCLPFEKDELKLLLSAADEVSGCKKKQEKFLRVDHPAKATIEAQRACWKREAYDPQKLFTVLSKTTLNLEVLAAAVDGQWAAIGDLGEIPQGSCRQYAKKAVA